MMSTQDARCPMPADANVHSPPRPWACCAASLPGSNGDNNNNSSSSSRSASNGHSIEVGSTRSSKIALSSPATASMTDSPIEQQQQQQQTAASASFADGKRGHRTASERAGSRVAAVSVQDQRQISQWVLQTPMQDATLRARCASAQRALRVSDDPRVLLHAVRFLLTVSAALGLELDDAAPHGRTVDVIATLRRVQSTLRSGDETSSAGAAWRVLSWAGELLRVVHSVLLPKNPAAVARLLFTRAATPPRLTGEQCNESVAVVLCELVQECAASPVSSADPWAYPLLAEHGRTTLQLQAFLARLLTLVPPHSSHADVAVLSGLWRSGAFASLLLSQTDAASQQYYEEVSLCPSVCRASAPLARCPRGRSRCAEFLRLALCFVDRCASAFFVLPQGGAPAAAATTGDDASVFAQRLVANSRLSASVLRLLALSRTHSMDCDGVSAALLIRQQSLLMQCAIHSDSPSHSLSWCLVSDAASMPSALRPSSAAASLHGSCGFFAGPTAGSVSSGLLAEWAAQIALLTTEMQQLIGAAPHAAHTAAVTATQPPAQSAATCTTLHDKYTVMLEDAFTARQSFSSVAAPHCPLPPVSSVHAMLVKASSLVSAVDALRRTLSALSGDSAARTLLVALSASRCMHGLLTLVGTTHATAADSVVSHVLAGLHGTRSTVLEDQQQRQLCHAQTLTRGQGLYGVLCSVVLLERATVELLDAAAAFAPSLLPFPFLPAALAGSSACGLPAPSSVRCRGAFVDSDVRCVLVRRTLPLTAACAAHALVPESAEELRRLLHCLRLLCEEEHTHTACGKYTAQLVSDAGLLTAVCALLRDPRSGEMCADVPLAALSLIEAAVVAPSLTSKCRRDLLERTPQLLDTLAGTVNGKHWDADEAMELLVEVPQDPAAAAAAATATVAQATPLSARRCTAHELQLGALALLRHWAVAPFTSRADESPASEFSVGDVLPPCAASLPVQASQPSSPASPTTRIRRYQRSSTSGAMCAVEAAGSPNASQPASPVEGSASSEMESHSFSGPRTGDRSPAFSSSSCCRTPQTAASIGFTSPLTESVSGVVSFLRAVLSEANVRSIFDSHSLNGEDAGGAAPRRQTVDPAEYARAADFLARAASDASGTSGASCAPDMATAAWRLAESGRVTAAAVARTHQRHLFEESIRFLHDVAAAPCFSCNSSWVSLLERASTCFNALLARRDATEECLRRATARLAATGDCVERGTDATRVAEPALSRPALADLFCAACTAVQARTELRVTHGLLETLSTFRELASSQRAPGPVGAPHAEDSMARRIDSVLARTIRAELLQRALGPVGTTRMRTCLPHSEDEGEKRGPCADSPTADQLEDAAGSASPSAADGALVSFLPHSGAVVSPLLPVSTPLTANDWASASAGALSTSSLSQPSTVGPSLNASLTLSTAPFARCTDDSSSSPAAAVHGRAPLASLVHARCSFIAVVCDTTAAAAAASAASATTMLGQRLHTIDGEREVAGAV